MARGYVKITKEIQQEINDVALPWLRHPDNFRVGKKSDRTEKRVIQYRCRTISNNCCVCKKQADYDDRARIPFYVDDQHNKAFVYNKKYILCGACSVEIMHMRKNHKGLTYDSWNEVDEEIDKNIRLLKLYQRQGRKDAKARLITSQKTGA